MADTVVLKLFLLSLCCAGRYVKCSPTADVNIVNGSMMRSLRCLGITGGNHSSSTSDCVILGLGVPVKSGLINIYNSQTVRVRDALNQGSLAALSDADLVTIAPQLLLLLPLEILLSEGSFRLAHLVNKWADVGPVVHHLFMAVPVKGGGPGSFLIKIQGANLWPDDQDRLGRIFHQWHTNYGIINVGDPLLAHYPPPLMSELNHSDRIKMLFNLKTWFLTNSDHKWNQHKPIVRRMWARMMLQSEDPKPLSEWKESELTKRGHLLNGLTTKELGILDTGKFTSRLTIFKFHFSKLQIRTLYRMFFHGKNMTAKEFSILSSNSVIQNLTPRDMADIPASHANFTSVSFLPTHSSLAIAKQMIEYRLAEASEKQQETKWTGEFETAKESTKLKSIGHLVYAMPSLRYAQGVRRLTLRELLSLQSDMLSPTQVYHLTGGGSVLDSRNPALFRYLIGLPSTAVHSDLDTKYLLSLIKRTPYFIPVIMEKILSLLPTNYLGNREVLKHIVKNPDHKKILSLLSPRDIATNSGELIDFISLIQADTKRSTRVDLPYSVARVLYESSSNQSAVSNFFMTSITCREVDMILPVDLPLALYNFNKQLSIQEKMFPKDLQECWTAKLGAYLTMKSSFYQQYLTDSPVKLLNIVDIDAIGGYVLGMLNEEDIEQSQFTSYIVAAIGRLHLDELILSAPWNKLRNIFNIYLKKEVLPSREQLTTGIVHLKFKDLYQLGNLISVAMEDDIARIDPVEFRRLLESRYIDTRLCSDSYELAAWRRLLIKALGPVHRWSGEEILLARDMMISLTQEDMNSLNNQALIDTADILKTKYVNTLYHHHYRKKFYQVCLDRLISTERSKYIEALKRLIKLHLRAASLQLNSVKSSKEIISGGMILKTFKTQPVKIERAVEALADTNYNTASTNSSPLSDVTSGVMTDPLSPSEYEVSSSVQSTSTVLTISEDKATHSDVQEDKSISKSGIEDHGLNKIESPFSFVDDNSLDISVNLAPAASGIRENILNPSEILREEEMGLTKGYSEVKYQGSTEYTLSSSTDENLYNNAYDKGITTFSTTDWYEQTESSEGETSITNSISYENASESVTETIPDLVTTIDQPFSVHSNSGESIKTTVVEDDTTETDELDHAFEEGSSENESRTSPSWNGRQTTLGHEDGDRLPTASEADEMKSIREILSDMAVLKPQHILKLDSRGGSPNVIFPLLHNSKIIDLNEEIQKAIKLDWNGRDEDLNELEDEILVPVESQNYVRSVRDPTLNDKKENSESEFMTCDAMKIVGQATEIVLDGDFLNNIRDSDLDSCTDLLAEMDLPFNTSQAIWRRLPRGEIHLKGKLTGAANISDIEEIDFNLDAPWTLETIYTLSRNNVSLKDFVVERLINQLKSRTLSPEIFVSLGSYVCHIVESKEHFDILNNSNSALKQAIQVLGDSLFCEKSCLEHLSSKVQEEKIFGNITKWTRHDVASLGIIVAGLNGGDWDQLLLCPDCLYGLTIKAAHCLSDSQLQKLTARNIRSLPFSVKQSLYESNTIYSMSSWQKELFHPAISVSINSDGSVRSLHTVSISSQRQYHHSLVILGFITYLLVWFQPR